MHTSGTVFSRPASPAAKCFQLVLLNPVTTRSELVELTKLSQPTITRAVTALLRAGLVQERGDLTQSRGRGRPTVPLEIADNRWMLAGIAVGTTSTYIAFYDIRGRTIREDDFATPVAELSSADFIEHILAGVNKLAAGLDRCLISVGVTTSGRVDDKGLVYAPNLGWEGVDIARSLRFQFNVPVTVTSAVPAILGSEIHSTGPGDDGTVMVLFADDSLGAALADPTGVRSLTLPALEGQNPESTLVSAAIARELQRPLPSGTDFEQHQREVLDKRARQLGQLTALLVRKHQPATVVIAGGAFYADPPAPKIFATTVRAQLQAICIVPPQLRFIPSHREIVRAIARAVAMDPLLRNPLELAVYARPD